MRKSIQKIKVDAANFDYIKIFGTINGSLLLDIEKVVKETSIDFAKWAGENDWEYKFPNRKKPWSKKYGEFVTKTNEQLFEIFINNQAKR
jgi:hypothetical protein